MASGRLHRPSVDIWLTIAGWIWLVYAVAVTRFALSVL